MVRRALVLLCMASMAVFVASCGTSNKLLSITVSPSQPNIQGISSPQALKVTANYSNTKTQDVTVRASYQLAGSLDTLNAPLDGLTINKSGILETTTVPACTWVHTLNPDGTTFTYAITSPYIATATFSGFTATAAVSVASAATCFNPLNPAPKPK
jgi:hypothetical protein